MKPSQLLLEQNTEWPRRPGLACVKPLSKPHCFVWVPLDQLWQKRLLPESLQQLIPQVLQVDPPHFYSEMTGSH